MAWSALDFMDSQQIATGILSVSTPSVVGWAQTERREMRVASTNTPQTWSPTGPTGSAASRRCPFLTSAAPLRNSGMRWTHCTPTE